MLKLHVLHNPGEEWDSFASRYSDIFFHTSSWGKVVAEGYGAELRYYCLYDNDEMVIGMPGFIYDLRFFRMLYSNVPYGGVIGERRYLKPFFDMLKVELEREGVHRVRVVNFPGISLELNDCEFQGKIRPSLESLHHMLYMNGFTYAEIWKGYNKSARWSVKNAERKGVKVEKINRRDRIPEAYECYLGAMKRNKAPASLPLDLLYSIYDYLVPEKADLFLAFLNGRCIGSLCLIYSEDHAHTLFAGSLTEHLRFTPNDLIYHAAIIEAHQRGKGCFDFIGTTSRDDFGLASFKEKWGAKRGYLPIFIWEVSRMHCAVWNIASRGMKTALGSKIIRYMR